MALRKNQDAAAPAPAANAQYDIPATTGNIPPEYYEDDAAWDDAPQPRQAVPQTDERALAQPDERALAQPRPAASNMSLNGLQDLGYEGLEFDWTSFPTISLKNEGFFEDTDKENYGTEFHCYIKGTKKRYVFRAAPYDDPRRDVLFTYDKELTQNGLPVEEQLKKWRSLGKTWAEKEYREALVELHAPGTHLDGEFRILSISPTSKGRISGYLAKAAFKGGGNPGNVLTTVKVGKKVEKVANPFYPWAFEIARQSQNQAA